MERTVGPHDDVEGLGRRGHGVGAGVAEHDVYTLGALGQRAGTGAEAHVEALGPARPQGALEVAAHEGERGGVVAEARVDPVTVRPWRSTPVTTPSAGSRVRRARPAPSRSAAATPSGASRRK